MKNNLYLWLLAFIVSGLSLNSSILAQEEIPTMSAGILMGEIELDGRLDEISWQQSTPGSNYIQGKPYEGSKALEETEVHVLIGEKFIYVGAQRYESDPAVIDKNLVRRDTEGQYDFITKSYEIVYDC